MTVSKGKSLENVSERIKAKDKIQIMCIIKLAKEKDSHNVNNKK